ncbi:MAG: PaaI family thioesterase [Acidimicrobiales bacterium]
MGDGDDSNGSGGFAAGGFEEQAAAAVRDFGHLLAGRKISRADAEAVEQAIHQLSERLAAAPERSKHEEHANSSRYEAFVRHGMPAPTADGDTIEFDRASIVGGAASPFGTGATHHRQGDEAITTVTFGPAFEGPPGRVHGGVVAMVVDEATATVMPMSGRFAFTGSVSLKLVGPAPLGVPLRFRSRLVGEEGRKLFVRCVGEGPEGVFVEADAIYIQVDPMVAMPWLGEARRAYLAATED